MKRFLQIVALYMFHLFFVRPVVLFVAGTRYRRRHLVPKGPCIVVANHNSHLDAAVLLTLFPLRRLLRVHPVAAADYFGETWFMRLMAMTMMNAMPIARKPEPGVDPLAPVTEALDKGDSLIFFPEGSRGKAGVVAPFRSGIGRLVQSHPGLLILPVFMSGPEKIWARGQLIPVPVNIYANVGKPRRYDPTLPARRIAQQVREDVLALAPPPPAPPGRKNKPPFRVAVCSVDPVLRRGVFMDVTARIGKREPTVGLSDQVLRSDENGIREAGGGIPLAYGRSWPSLLAWIFRTGGWFRGGDFGKMIERTRLNEALGDGRRFRCIVEEGNALVDVLTWAKADFYQGRLEGKEPRQLLRYLQGGQRIRPGNWWSFLRKAPEVFLINIFDLARPPAPDLLVVLRKQPDEIMARLRARGERLRSFENRAFLGELQDTFVQVAEALRRKLHMDVLVLEAAGQAAEEIGAAVANACEKKRVTPEPETSAEVDC